jgi:hypothetical protein
MKDIKQFILESQNNEFNFNISKVGSGKRNDVFLFKKIQKSLELNKDTSIYVDCGSAGTCEIQFNNFDGHNECNINIRFKDLGKYMKFSKEVDSEWSNNGSWKDLYNTMLIILRNIQSKL